MWGTVRGKLGDRSPKFPDSFWPPKRQALEQLRRGQVTLDL